MSLRSTFPLKTFFPAVVLWVAVLAACKKEEIIFREPGTTDTCSWKRLTGIRTSQGTGKIYYNADGSIGDPNVSFRYFNNGELVEVVGKKDTVVLDSLGRLSYLKIPFDWDKRQTRYYFYDQENRVTQTLTHTGNGVDYWAGLEYRNGDVVAHYYHLGAATTSISRFSYTYYDTPCVDRFMGQQYWGQIGTTYNKHLLKTYYDGANTTYYSYVLDSNQRVLISYRDYDNSGWTYARAIDTTYYIYGCQ